MKASFTGALMPNRRSWAARLTTRLADSSSVTTGSASPLSRGMSDSSSRLQRLLSLYTAMV